jgi:hypothetical protein
MMAVGPSGDALAAPIGRVNHRNHRIGRANAVALAFTSQFDMLCNAKFG